MKPVANLDVTIRALASAPLFSAFSATELATLAAQSRRRHYDDRDVVFYFGDPGNGLFIVLAGTIKIAVNAPDGQETMIALLGAGECFGEMAVLDGQPRSATASAMEKTETLFLPRTGFLAFLEQHRDAVHKIILLLARRLRETDEHVADLVFHDVYGRLAKRLLHLAEHRGQKNASGRIEIDLPLTQQDLANLVGASRESVNKAMKDFRAKGYVTVMQQRITVNDRAALRASVEASLGRLRG
ncbi:MAG: Crp/Fnr family transcriptional regulator [Chloroflexota bacterium]|nr:MAG: Crp/Fnr family transcriptional regulator [Chloroflexota bacterium]